MNEQFFELPEEKRLRIINAGFEVFGNNDYKRASTDLIAAKADISKGLLFYYFHNKKSLYLYLFQYAEEQLKQSVLDDHFGEIQDFFELYEYALIKKYQILVRNPHMMDFVIRAFFSEKEEVSEDMNKEVRDTEATIFPAYFNKIDLHKFKENVNPQEILQMLMWMAEGCLHEHQRSGKKDNFEALMEHYHRWIDLFKQIAYKEEFLNE